MGALYPMILPERERELDRQLLAEMHVEALRDGAEAPSSIRIKPGVIVVDAALCWLPLVLLIAAYLVLAK